MPLDCLLTIFANERVVLHSEQIAVRVPTWQGLIYTLIKHDRREHRLILRAQHVRRQLLQVRTVVVSLLVCEIVSKDDCKGSEKEVANEVDEQHYCDAAA